MKLARRLLLAFTAACALAASATRAAAPAVETTHIHEFTHPRVVVHYHPRAGMQFLLEHARYALENGAHGLELDLHMRGDEVVCNHDGPTPQSPRLRDVLTLILQYQGQRATVHGDDRQFFLVLEPKDNDPALFQQVFDILGEHLSRLSTAAAPGDPPRGITVVVTGAWLAQMRARFADRLPDLNRRCILENHDYTGEITNLSSGAIPFQWTAIQHPGEQGRVNALHAGSDARLTGRYNIRVWGSGADVGGAFFSGADSVNCDHEQVVPFEDFLRHQNASGYHPSLAARGGQALLAWRGASSTSLYIAQGAATRDGISFPRQLNLSAFLTEKPAGLAPAAALMPDGRLLVVYEGTASHRLWYVSGRFTSAERFLTFSGGQKRLTPPDDANRRGTQPAVAVGPDGRVVILYRAPDGAGLRYVTARMDSSGALVGAERTLTLGRAAFGDAPSISINASGHLLLAYRDTADSRIHAVVGALDDLGAITGVDSVVSSGDDGIGTFPAAALDDHGEAFIAWQGAPTDPLRAFWGCVGADGAILGTSFAWKEAGSRPAAVFLAPDRPALLYEAPGAFRWASGTLGVRKHLDAAPATLDIGMDPL